MISYDREFKPIWLLMLMSNLRCVLDIDYLKRTDTTNDRSQKAEKHHDDIVISLIEDFC